MISRFNYIYKVVRITIWNSSTYLGTIWNMLSSGVFQCFVLKPRAITSSLFWLLFNGTYLGCVQIEMSVLKRRPYHLQWPFLCRWNRLVNGRWLNTFTDALLLIWWENAASDIWRNEEDSLKTGHTQKVSHCKPHSACGTLWHEWDSIWAAYWFPIRAWLHAKIARALLLTSRFYNMLNLGNS